MNSDHAQAPLRAPIQHSYLVLGKLLGSGGFGSVYKAYWGNQPCAVKTFFLTQSELAQQSIQTEISFHQKLRHRHIIQFYRTHEEYGSTYLLMELAENGSLQQAILNNHLELDDWTTKRRLTSEIAQGLAFIHQEGIVHRDLKSANVLLTKHMEVKLADFGMARIKSMTLASMRSSQSKTGLAGTLRWVAPELLFAKKPVYTARSDVYALGVVMWEMAVNCTRPFKDQDNDALVALAVSQGERETFPDNTPIDYRSWAQQCWFHRPIHRPDAWEVVQIHVEPTRGTVNDGNDDIFLDFSFDQSEGTDGQPGTQSDHKGPLGAKTTHYKKADQHVGRLPSTDDDMITHMCMAAKQGSTEAQLFLGWIYAHGHGVDKSDKDAFWWYRLAASHGTVVAQLRVAKMYEQGQGVDANVKKAASWYLRAADGGSASAQYQIGRMYDDGRGINRDFAEASRWYHSAANLGQSDAQYKLWQMYSLGRWVKQSDEEAFKWLTMAAQHDNATAQYHLGMMYCNRCRISKNDTEGVEWHSLEVEQGNVALPMHLGSMYDEGPRVEHSTALAVKWFTKAAEQGSQAAQFELGFMYQEGRGVEQSNDEAFKWFTMAAGQGHVVSQDYLGWMYQNGEGVEQSASDAVKWYTKAAEQGHGVAQYSLGLMFQQGHGIDQSDIEAVKWFTKAAEAGIQAAQFNLGWMYEKGRGVEQSYMEAVSWYAKASKQGFWPEESSPEINRQFRRNNTFIFKSMSEKGRGIGLSDIEAFKWFTKGAEYGIREAPFILGFMYMEGRGVEQSEDEAVKWLTEASGNEGSFLFIPYPDRHRWLTKAAEHGVMAAQFHLGLAAELGVMAAQFHPGLEAELGVMAMQFHLGFGYEDFSLLNQDEAIKWYTKAAEQGHVKAQRRLGAMYLEGEGIKRSFTDAFKWLTKAAEHGDAEIQNSVGRLYDLGKGVKQSDSTAFVWYSRSAAQENPDAQFNLGSMYELGLWVNSDRDEALRLYWKAYERQRTNAQFHIKWLTSYHFLSERTSTDLSDVVLLNRRGAKQGYAAAQYNLGRVYEKGLGVAKNMEQAIAWYRKAADQGHADAEVLLKFLQKHEE